MLKNVAGSITPLLAELTMRDCAAGSGAAVVPTAHVLQRHLAPRRASRAPFVDVAAVRPDCLPGVSGELSTETNGALLKTFVLFAFVVLASAILNLGDAVARGRDYLKGLLDD